MREGPEGGTIGVHVLRLGGLEALNAKGEAIKRAKAAHFKQDVADAARGSRSIWPLAK
jgi:hypothetical protein